MRAKNDPFDPNELPPPRDLLCEAIVEQIATLIFQMNQKYHNRDSERRTKELLVKLFEQL